MSSAPLLVLASTSVYRRELLSRLGLPFTAESPGVEETELPGESPAERALRLAVLKARAVAARHPAAVVIGSDQVASLAEGPAARILHKPGTPARNRDQLAALSGRTARFDTAVAVVSPSGIARHVDRTEVRFRELGPADIARYVEREAALDCAGGFKVEGLGPALMESVTTSDPTGLVGLPLIWLCGALRGAGFSLP